MNDVAERLGGDRKEELERLTENTDRLDLVIDSLKFVADLGAATTLVRPHSLRVNW